MARPVQSLEAQAKSRGNAMKGMNSRWAVIPVATAAIVAMTAAAQQRAIQTAVPQRQADQREIIVSLEDRKLALIEDGEVKKVYTVAVGKPSTPSPEGTFTIQRRVVNPTYHHDGKTVLPGLHNPVGTRWMGLSKAGYGIHGTNEPKSVGKASSHGCIRMAQADLEEFYGMVAVGDTVRLIGHRDEETARLFGPVDLPAAATAEQPVQTAHTDSVPAAPAASDSAPAAISTPSPAATTMISLGTR
jgi:lipoprotein-anchoring transpeptidase ErfK/SrfK